MASAVNRVRSSVVQAQPFKIGDLHPRAVNNGLAMDSALAELSNWGAQSYGQQIMGGDAFPGYPTLSVMATIAEYRRAVETVARHMTRRWIKFLSVGEGDKIDKIQKIEAEMKRLAIKAAFQKMAEHDGYFGRSHLFLDFGDWDDRDELATPAGDGENDTSKSKCSPKRPLKRVKPVEAVWCYPLSYNASDPLSPDWYKPQTWSVMGKSIHATRLLTFIGREVPDMLKPTYSFGGLSLSQMAKPSVDNWLETRQSVNDIISAFSVMVLQVDLQQVLQGAGEQLFQRIELFNAQRDNRGLLTIGKEEDFKNISAPLNGLDALQAQAQEHMASIWGIPIEILNGIQPMGLNASSEGQIRVFYDWINSCQEHQFRPHLTTVINFIQLSIWGDVDPDITFEFEDLEGANDKEQADIELVKAQTHQVYSDMGAVDAGEVRQSLIDDPDSIYHGLSGDLPQREGEEEPPSPWDSLAESVRRANDSAEFKEDQHPRDKDGKFGSGGGSSAAATSVGGAKSKLRISGGKVEGGHALTFEPGGPMEEGKKVKGQWTAPGVDPVRIKALAIPPGWSSCVIASDPSDDLQAIGHDAKGRPQYRYSEAFAQSQAAQKFERIKQFEPRAAALGEASARAMDSGDDSAAAVRLMWLTGMRPGSEADTGAEKKAHGATNLRKDHVSVSGDTVHYDFIGKEGVRIQNRVKDQTLADYISKKLKESKEGRLFNTDETKAREFLKSVCGSEFKSKDLRTLKANQIAEMSVANTLAPKNEKDFRRAVNSVADVVSAQLGNTRVMALGSYINPAVFDRWRAAKDASDG